MQKRGEGVGQGLFLAKKGRGRSAIGGKTSQKHAKLTYTQAMDNQQPAFSKSQEKTRSSL
jgi:hypothetical protein